MKINNTIMALIGLSLAAFIGAGTYLKYFKHTPESAHTKSEAKQEKSHEHAEGEHDDSPSTTPSNAEASEHGDNGAEESDHAHAGEGEDGHGHGEEGEEENSAVGPDKGITKADKNLGFQLSESAKKTYRLSTVPATPGQNMILPPSAIFYGLQERNIFRVRDGYIKRIDFKFVSNTKSQVIVQIEDLKTGDEIVTTGLGFLRIAELAASGGGAVGHAH